MSIPTNNLYNFVAQALENKYLLKYFYPYGQKQFKNVINNEEDLRPDLNYNDMPVLMCHDQEPLNFELYNDEQFNKQINNLLSDEFNSPPEYKDRYKCLQKAIKAGRKNLNLRWVDPSNRTDKWILLHSELNSQEVIKYTDTKLFKCAYWWAHAPLAIDWYRFARYDTRLERQYNNIKANFLIYARSTTGNREYRKSFLEQLQHVNNVQIGSINQYEVNSNSSANYDAYDFAHTHCSIILETVYDERIHLTEKTLRPLACGHPFLILNGPGSLETIRSYGFKTFHPFINETYDQEKDADKRMKMVIDEMQRINNSSTKYQQYIWENCNHITEYNKRLFFDDKFIWRVKTELRRTVRTV